MSSACVVDIETVPDPEAVKAAVADLRDRKRPPKNYKSPEAIERWYKAQEKKVATDAALDIFTGRVACVGMFDAATVQGRAVCIDDERQLLEAAATRLWAAARIVTFNGRSFDLPFLRARMFKHGVTIPTVLKSEGRYTLRKQVDLYDVFTDFGNRQGGGLDQWAQLIGAHRPIRHSPEQIRRHFVDGDYEWVARVCESDCVSTADLYERALATGWVQTHVNPMEAA